MQKAAFKRLLAGLMALIMALGMSGCGREGMYIEKARLSRAEQDIVKLLGSSGDTELIYDYRVDGSVQSVQVNSYELIDGQWQSISGGGSLASQAKKGRVALRFGILGDELRVALQNGHDVSASETKNPSDSQNFGHISTVAADHAQITYDREIPLAVQINTGKNEVRTFSAEAYFSPEQLMDGGYEHVYALTIIFSTSPLE